VGRCSPVPVVVNTFPNTSLALPGTVVQYECKEGFHEVDDLSENILTCANGEWKGIGPSCQGY